MKLPRQKKSAKKALLLALAAFFIVGGGATAWFLQPQTAPVQDSDIAPTNTVNYDPPTADEQAAQEEQKEEIIKNNTETPAPDTSLNLTISRADQGGSGQPINVRTIVGGTTSGSCEATFTRGDKKIVRVFTIAQAAASVTCNGDVEAAAFGEAGEWQISITGKSGSKASAPAVQKVMVAL